MVGKTCGCASEIEVVRQSKQTGEAAPAVVAGRLELYISSPTRMGSCFANGLVNLTGIGAKSLQLMLFRAFPRMSFLNKWIDDIYYAPSDNGHSRQHSYAFHA